MYEEHFEHQSIGMKPSANPIDCAEQTKQMIKIRVDLREGYSKIQEVADSSLKALQDLLTDPPVPVSKMMEDEMVDICQKLWKISTAASQRRYGLVKDIHAMREKARQAGEVEVE